MCSLKHDAALKIARKVDPALLELAYSLSLCSRLASAGIKSSQAEAGFGLRLIQAFVPERGGAFSCSRRDTRTRRTRSRRW